MRFLVWGRKALAGLVLATGAALATGQGATLGAALPVIHVDNGPNSEAAQNSHYVVLVSLDGFRWDYAKRYGATHLLSLGKHGVWAPEGMLPSFPSLTFPNHFTIVTGLYPEHHGLVANGFYDETKNARYGIGDSSAVTDGSWYKGVPLWSLAESQGMRTACFFWPGSEAKIAGFRPTYYLKFDNKIDDNARIQQVLDWLHLPPADRPHFITLYYSEPDHEGHEFGPDAPETKAAVLKVDALMGKLKEGLDATHLPLDLVVVSDHGMAKEQGDWINLDQFADLSGFETVGPLLYPKTDADADRVYNQLKKASPQFVVYRRKNVPADLDYNQNPREGDPVVIATGPYAIRAHGPTDGKPDHAPTVGMHGFDPHKMPEMKASFYAEGRDIVSGRTVRPFENVNLYPWIAHMLGLKPPKSDGSLNILAGTLRDGGAEASQ
ncbi:MAG TPA: ectonucleotide pyrophosphatase/phosphodiesterase [Terracidiphilus sp.]|jgi:predicted AlkP superfamily pyrophosphatase or phosphodiesterase|nr:ectonucleotide pyrophosphatase/phosphodiesterase [Terracidiphilus sp.]